MNPGINLDGDAAVVGGIHSDSHDVTNNVNTYNTTNTTTNNQTVHNNIYQAQKTAQELSLENEQLFLQAVSERLTDGILTDIDLAQLNQIRLQLQIPELVASHIIEEVRKSAIVLNAGNVDNFLSTQLLEEIYNAIAFNKVEILTRKFSSLEKIAKQSQDGEVQFYYHMLLSSLYPEKCTVSFINTSTDNYWQLFWAHLAYLKLGNAQTAEVLLPRLSGFGAPQGDIALMMALDNLWDYKHNGENEYYAQQASSYLEKAVTHGMNDMLSPLWTAASDILQGVESSGQFTMFFATQTLKEFNTSRQEKAASVKMAPPEMPKFNAQNVNLSQMQGFNPLQAAKNMGIGSNAGMPQMSSMPSMPSMPQAGFPQMPSMSSMPQGGFSQVPSMPSSMPQGGFSKAPSMPQQVKSSKDVPDEFNEHYGIVLTDTNLLAQKYGVERSQLIAIFSDFFSAAEGQNMHWGFLDVADHYGEMQSNDWIDYNRLVSSFVEQYGLPAGPDLHLMIVGGADVVPVPQVNDPYEYGSGKIPTDMPYCFDGTYLTDLVDGGDFTLDASHARNNVARLPLEDGQLSTDPVSDLGSYFNLSGAFSGGIPVDSVVMCSNSEWIPASVTMSQHLPLLYDDRAPELIKDRMYISPGVLTSDPNAIAIYIGSAADADMLMFNLHGADAPDMPGFYSEDEAFNPGLLNKSGARVLNTVACFGARYTGGYTREQSMLLSALYGGGILLYAGSLMPVPMYANGTEDELRELMLHPGTGSEVFMRLFPLYQFKGMTAGCAMLYAKCDYFNMMRRVEQDGFSLSTALMFCLYGNPMLHVKARQDVVDAARGNTSIPASPVKSMPGNPVKQVLKQRVMSRDDSKGLLDQLRGYVDNNIATIRSMTEQYVYQALGLPPAYLESIDAISQPLDNGSYEMGYSFNYRDPRARFSPDKHVVTDAHGKVKRIYSFK